MRMKEVLIFLVVFFGVCLTIRPAESRKRGSCRTAFYKLPSPQNGQLKQRRSYRFAKYSCNKGYILFPEESRERRCVKGQYVGSAPKCIARMKCPTPQPPPHGLIITENPQLTTGARITYQCGEGYYLMGKKTRKCNELGQWTGTMPTCRNASECLAPTEIEHGYVNFTGKATGSIANYSCVSEFYRLEGDQTRTCTKMGEWSGQPPECVEKRCKRLTRRLRNGKWNATDPNHKLYSSIEFSCNDGFEFEDDEVRSWTCLEYGWSPSIWPKCRVPLCPNIQLEHGRTCCGRKFAINSTMYFRCNSGFTLHGPEKLTCTSDKTWSGVPPVCDNGATDCINPGIPVSGKRIGTSYNENDEVKFSCDKSFVLVGSKNRTCINGTWTGTQPQCIDQFDDRFYPTLNEIARDLRENVIDPLKPISCASDSENSTCDTRGRSINMDHGQGLDIVFVLDKSSSISRKNFQKGLQFVKKMIDTFGASPIEDEAGTQVALVTYSSVATLEFNWHDDRASTREGAKRLVEETKYSGGGTNTRAALELVEDVVVPMKRKNSLKVMFIVADGNSNIGSHPEKKADELRKFHNFRIHVLAVGRKIAKGKLQLLADEPLDEHFFVLKNYDNLEEVMDAVKETDQQDYSVCGQSPYDPRGRVIGGVETVKGEWPWVVSLQWNGNHKCGGSVIQEGWILTAAHCFEDKNMKKGKNPGDPQTFKGLAEYEIVAGAHKLDSIDPLKQQIRSPCEIYIHQEWDRTDYVNDIALIKLPLEESLHYSRFVAPACRPFELAGATRNKLIAAGRSAVVVGWGRTTVAQEGDKEFKDASDILLRTAVPFADTEKCNQSSGPHFYSEESMLCAGDGSGRNDTCYGDSGGPLVTYYFDKETNTPYWIQVGIISWGRGCGLKDTYGYYTNLKNYDEWIENTMAYDAEHGTCF